MIPSVDIPAIATHYTLPLTKNVRLAHSLFFGTFLFQVVNTALRHPGSSGYWFYILILEGPVMLFNLVVIYSAQQWWATKKNFPMTEYQSVVLWSYGSLTMPSTETISDDIQLALAVPAASFVLFVFWLILYVVFEEDAWFDATFWHGVQKDELSSFGGVLDNIFAQAAWRSFTLLFMGLIIPTYPLSASALWAGAFCKFTPWTHQKIALVTDVAGLVMATVLFLIGTYETVWDDDNGIGIWHLLNSGVLIVFTLPRLLSERDTDASGHELMGRPCYQEKEEGEETTAATGAAAVTVPEQELPNVTQSENSEEGDDNMQNVIV